MKLEPRRVEAFLNDPGAARVVLLYGDDAGQIADRAVRLVRRVAGNAADPFLTAELTRDSFARIGEEMTALALTGGRRVIRVRDASDACTAEVEGALAGKGTALLILEAHGLPSRSRLRAAVEKAADAVAIGCYAVEGASLGREIRDRLQERGVSVDPAALAWLEARLTGDLAAARGEVEKLALYVGPNGTADLAAASACVGDLAAVSVEDALFAATAGDVGRADRALALAFAEGAAPVAVLRAGLAHVQRLHRARLVADAGASPAEAAKSVRPPLFFRREPDFVKALRLWPSARLAAAAAALWRDESACKR
ncbi:MAG TPA: DNA polymerase III subunit delta, partial [Acetobacteraceae bacterium]|nr:DNA polymerase III subunit delta [Acetobacteraceae bacterium]